MTIPSSRIAMSLATEAKILVMIAIIFLTGCSLSPTTPTRSPEPESLQAAVNAYLEGRYAEAESLFTRADESAGDESIQRAARHGLACTRIMLAQSPETLQAALNMRDEWQTGNVNPPRNEDLRLYGPILAKLTALIRNPEPPQEAVASEPQAISPEVAASPAPPEVPVAQPQAPPSQDAPEIVADLQKRLRSQQDENRRLRRQMRKLEKALRAIQEQMTAIEEIHREIYEKKKEMQLP